MARSRPASDKVYAVKQGEPDRLTETSQFVHVWKEDNGHWRLAAC